MSAIRIERSGAVARILLGPAGGVPSIDLACARDLADAVREVAGDRDVRAVVLASEGKLFCAGGDIRAMAAAGDARPSLLAAILDDVHAAVLALRRMPQPVITAVNGAAAGAGFSLAMAGDVVLASNKARFVVGYPGLGTTSDGGLSYFLRQRIGPMRAMDLLLVRESIDAAEAERLGLVLRCVDAAALMDEANAYAERLATQPAQVLEGFKALLNGADAGALVDQLDRERVLFLRNSGTALFGERLAAFLQR
jgi:2-(1,2-epoxy-1,2-dihydrophenyl)acetyl-CoA isomerase